MGKNNQTIKIGIIGCGKNGVQHANSMRSMGGVEVAAIADASEPRLTELRADFSSTVFYQDYTKMLEKEKLDAVVISTPHSHHYQQTMTSLKKGCHVLLEKPMALNENHCREMVNLARKKNLILQIGFECRTSTLYKRIKEIIDSGEIGELLSMSFIHYRRSWLCDWYCNHETAGSMAVIETCHYIDLMRFWSGKDVDWVSATVPKANLRTEYNYPDTSFVHLGFEDGMVGNIIDSHARSADRFFETVNPDKSYGQGEGEYQDPVYGHQFEYSIVGMRGSLFIRMMDKQISVFDMDDSGSRPELVLKRIEDYKKQSVNELTHCLSSIDLEFIKGIKTGKGALFSADDAMNSTLVAFAIEKSEQTGEKEYVSKA